MTQQTNRNRSRCPKQPPPPENLYFNLDNQIPDLKFTKPTAISFGEQIVSISTWTDVLIQTVSYIVQNEPDTFNSLVKQYGDSGSGLHLFSRAKFEKLTCKQINSDYYLNTNFSSTGTVKTAWTIMQSCKLPLSEVRIEYFSGGTETQNRSSSSSLQVAADNTSFTKPVNKSMFKTCIVVPTQCHNAFYSNLTKVPEAGTSVPVTMWLNGSPYSVSVQNPDFSVCGAPPQVRFTWNASSPIVQALKKECPISYKLFQSSEPVPSGTEPENVTVSLGVKPDEFIMKINDSSTDAQPERQQELFSRTEEETHILCDNILQRAKKAFPENSCHQRRINVLTQQFKEDFSTDEDIIDFIVRNHIGVYSQSWIYFLTDEVADRLLDIISQLHKEGQILAYYGLLHDRKFESFDSVKIFKNEEAIAGLFIALRERYGHGVVPFYPMPQRLALEIDAATIKDALLHYFENNSALTYEQIKDQFPYIPEKLVQDELKADDDFIALENCKYALTDTIELDDKHCQKLVAKIESEIQKHGWISCNDIDVTPFLEDYPEMTARAILDYFCKKILPKQYVRKDKGNVISDRSKPVNSTDILTDFCISNSSITYSQLINFAEELSASQQTALSVAFDKMVRIDKDKFIAPDLIQFDVEKIDNALESFVSSNDFIPLQDVTSFSFFPKCGSYSWNWFLLESFCRKYSNLFGFMVAKYNSSNAGAIVRKSAKFDDYNMLMTIAVINNEIELTTTAIRDFLIAAHYIAKDNTLRIQNVLAKAQLLRESRG